MVSWLKRVLKKRTTLSAIVVAKTTIMNRSLFDFFAQDDIRNAMTAIGYTYVGKPGTADASDPDSYRA